jgi:maltooligosyltrehalose trehalohydrolase
MNKPIPGIRFENGEALIALWSPTCKNAAILINQTEKHSLYKVDFGYWTLNTGAIKPGDIYQFLLDDVPYPDPASLSQPDGVNGPSMTLDLGYYQWHDGNWSNPPLEDYIIYELHTGTFTPEGTFDGIADKLDYLKELGITAVEIMPVAQFPGERNWGYDGVYPYAVQNSYGGAEGLMKLVDACHQKGIAVILDVVYNHLGPEGNYFANYGPYFTDKYHTPWGNAINFDDAWCDEVRHYFIENALMWFRDFHIDALRLDAVHAVKDLSPKHILQELKERTPKGHHLIIEFDLNDSRFIDPIKKGGFGMDAQWIDEFHHALRVTAGGGQDGYYADFNGIVHLAKSYNSAYVYDGIYSPHRLKIFGIPTQGNPGNQFVVFSQNHDQVGNRMLGERSSMLFSYEMQKLMAAAVMVSPFIPMLFMGEEWSAQEPFLYFVSHGDPDLIKAVRKGRKAEFAAFHTDGEAPDPQAKETFEESKLDWQRMNHTMLDYYKNLIALRKQFPALYQLNRKLVKTTVNESDQTLLLQRGDQHQNISCLMNFSGERHQTGVLSKLFDSAGQRWNGPGSLKGYIQPQSIIIYTNHV